MYTPRLDEHGQPCCTRTDTDGTQRYGVRVAGKLRACTACQAHHGAISRAMQAAERRTTEEHTTMTDDYAPPDSYAPALAAFRTPEQRLAAEQKAAALDAITSAAAAMEADVAKTLRALKAAGDLSRYAPPCPYKAGLDKMRSEGR